MKNFNELGVWNLFCHKTTLEKFVVLWLFTFLETDILAEKYFSSIEKEMEDKGEVG